ncbi:MAG: excinuclease subunit [Acidobacteriaceae bacterium]|nr:excinuclease subunit [Acidobacteriaceae bacterium]
MLELDFSLDFDPASDEQFFSVLPSKLAVCLVELNDSNAEPLLIRTQDLQRRLKRLLGPPDPTSKRLNLRTLARGVKYRAVGSTFEQSLTYYQHAKKLFPQRYRDLLRMRPPAVLKVSLRNAYPRCYVTRHISVDASGVPTAGSYYGPFPSRGAALAFGNRALDFFKMRRCQIKIRRDPTFPGCLYSEMKMCLAPCFAGCSKEEYDTEVQRFVKFLESSGESLRATFESERERASDDLDFERAATLHKKVEKLDEVLRGRPDLARRIQALDAVILQRGAGDQVVAAYRVQGGRLCEPFFLPFGEIASQPRSAEQIFRNYLDPAGDSAVATQSAVALPNVVEHAGPAQMVEQLPLAKGELSEHLSLVARWFYSNPRTGEIFFREKNDWPYRRILRACSRLLAPPDPPKEATVNS